ncbi:hypothetical protein EMIHUDRAFT_115369 [Emiliania huxleyi CCMP1516]|uniref:Uncharacterized protein n=2 Tax=Emiliania huxleyi TaxID=2903 RepID=A0A0D3JQ50_EMIH1|nr:hypothetical protein EMIHUDRAFT_115369 [Emiliania huxleyi CCMP1516]EOD25635.1 hypothetical protein EMIHUDRAFT_115369 [Emiliania huxleyi CCMP1516]|eukprot:XP_005778064.1 hypothetical protein EMIHUDRAFT_115369 [Emiliania huxleyi CCMP1516]
MRLLATAIAARPLLVPRAAPAALLDVEAVASVHTTLGDLSSTLAFADQAGNLAGTLFPLSLPPYLLFLYFICQDCNGLSPTAKAGFTSLLAFVFATVATSVVAVKSYGLNLANVDWLHSGAEQLLSFTNVCNVVGLKLTLDAYSAGGNLPGGLWTVGFAEPANALSVPTWTIHVSSLLEWLVAMGREIGEIWGDLGRSGARRRQTCRDYCMIPSHSSGVCACVYHFFYNAESLQFIAALTLLGNCTLAFAAWRLAASNGYAFSLPSLGDPGGGEAAEEQEGAAAAAVARAAAADTPAAAAASAAASAGVDGSGGDLSGLLLVLAVSVASSWSIVVTGRHTLGMTAIVSQQASSYVIKYGETLLPVVAEGDSLAVLAPLMVVAATGFNCWKWWQRSQEDRDFGGLI